MPAISRLAQRRTNGMIEGSAACFTGLEDPRETRRCDHQDLVQAMQNLAAAAWIPMRQVHQRLLE
jgi:hypothetical protein